MYVKWSSFPHHEEYPMKPRFQLWDSDSANLVGLYESIPEIVEDLDRTSTA